MALQSADQREFDRIISQVETLANNRMQRLIRQWNRRSAKRLVITFGMGDSIVEIDGKNAHNDWGDIDLPKIVSKAIADVEEITFDYRIACPESIDTEDAHA